VPQKKKEEPEKKETEEKDSKKKTDIKKADKEEPAKKTETAKSPRGKQAKKADKEEPKEEDEKDSKKKIDTKKTESKSIAKRKADDSESARKSKKIKGEDKEEASDEAVEDEKDSKKGSAKEKSPKKKPASKKEKKLISKFITLCSIDDDEEKSGVSDGADGLGDCKIIANFSEKITHVVMGDNKRKFKLLGAIALGVWVVDASWITKSVEAGAWVSEKGHENTAFKGCKLSRQAKEAGKKALLHGVKICLPSKKDLKIQFDELTSLIKWLGGSIVRSYAECDVCITNKYMKEEDESKRKTVTDDWILDSIVNYKLEEYSNYYPKKEVVADPQPKKKRKSSKSEESGEEEEEQVEDKMDDEDEDSGSKKSTGKTTPKKQTKRAKKDK